MTPKTAAPDTHQDGTDTTPEEREAWQLGYNAGQASASWIDTDEIPRILQGMDDGDPEILDAIPSPLSGEWADSPTPASLAHELGLDPADGIHSEAAVEACCDAYEQGYEQGWETELRSRLEPLNPPAGDVDWSGGQSGYAQQAADHEDRS